MSLNNGTLRVIVLALLAYALTSVRRLLLVIVISKSKQEGGGESEVAGSGGTCVRRSAA
jgi:hypothetical protein